MALCGSCVSHALFSTSCSRLSCTAAQLTVSIFEVCWLELLTKLRLDDRVLLGQQAAEEPLEGPELEGLGPEESPPVVGVGVEHTAVFPK